MNESIILIVNADDFGHSQGVNQGVIQSHEQGVVTSASLMVRGEEADAAAAYARCHPDLSVGLHIDLGEWRFCEGQWLPVYTVVPLEDFELVGAEIHRQLALFRHLLQRNPTHLDSHQHIHRHGAALKVAVELARELRVPLRHQCAKVRYCGEFYGQPSPLASEQDSVSVTALLGIISALAPGITELACHPGCDEGLKSDYAKERLWETATLCDPAVRTAIEKASVQLRPFDSSEVRGRLN